jgi:hypothetical protein
MFRNLDDVATILLIQILSIGVSEVGIGSETDGPTGK